MKAIRKANCYICGKKDLTRDEVGLNIKLIGREQRNLLCMRCLAEHLEIAVEDLEERIQEFKDAGCELFG
ncbi:MAG TPA: hypothetical protein PLB79_01155 [Thermotogota bacterium]|nr:hypothetical protein [Thermotogota bacterium]HNY82669.1 hypothetical protein [Thermotogota bacterium]HOD90788.1 hypothetical protein [Thermotogota bacterium]HOF23148.1 hypothetical protein [Thermotogota bacterium]HOH12300.1 hypothetical protein [Thermotogota bacterium]